MNEGILAEVSAERERQVRKFGVQNCPSFRPRADRPTTLAAVLVQHGLSTTNLKWECEFAFEDNEGSWAAILLEEVWEAFEAGFLGRTSDLREELVQVAAVAVAWVDYIDREGP